MAKDKKNMHRVRRYGRKDDKRGNNNYRDTRNEKPETKKAMYENDPIWYMSNEYINARMADINWSNVAGLGLELSEAPHNTSSGYAQLTDSNNRRGTTQFVQTGVGILRYVPSINVETGGGAINTCAQSIFTFVRKNNAAGTPYQSADLVMYLLAMDSAYAFFAMVRRAFALYNYYTMFNRYTPKVLLEALGFSDDEIADNHNAYLTFINKMAEKLNTLAVPNGVSYYARHIWMNSFVWTDEPGITSGYYAYVPEGFYYYSHTTNFQGGELIFKPWATQGVSNVDTCVDHHSLASLQAYWNANFQPLFNDQDVAIMSGDILRAYGDDLMRIAPTSADYAIIPQFSQEVLDQICNTRFMGVPVKEYGIYTDACNIKQSNGKVLYYPVVWNPCGTSFENVRVLINSSKDDVTPNDILVDTRNIAAVLTVEGKYVAATSFPSAEGITFYDTKFDRKHSYHTISTFRTCGSEWFTILEYRKTGWDPVADKMDIDSQTIGTFVGPNLIMLDDINHFGWGNNINMMSVGMNYHPRWYSQLKTTITNNTSNFGSFAWNGGFTNDADFHRFTAFAPYVLENMNDAIMYSMFDIAKY